MTPPGSRRWPSSSGLVFVHTGNHDALTAFDGDTGAVVRSIAGTSGDRIFVKDVDTLTLWTLTPRAP